MRDELWRTMQRGEENESKITVWHDDKYVGEWRGGFAIGDKRFGEVVFELRERALLLEDIAWKCMKHKNRWHPDVVDAFKRYEEWLTDGLRSETGSTE